MLKIYEDDPMRFIQQETAESFPETAPNRCFHLWHVFFKSRHGFLCYVSNRLILINFKHLINIKNWRNIYLKRACIS